MNEERESEAEIRRAAADWVVRRDAGLSPDEQDRFLQWLAADERHREWLARQSGSWAALDGLGDLRPIPHTDSISNVPVRPLARRWRAPALVLLATAAVVVMMFFVGGGLSDPARVPPLLERRVLEDGSVAELKEGAEVEVHYSAAQRRLTLLRGEARFIVQKDAGRPFLVDAGGVAVRAVGTAFNVSLLRQTVEVVVTEGQIKLLETAARGSEALVPAADTVAPLLVAGQRAIERLGELARELGGHRVLIVSDPGVVAAGIYQIGADQIRDAGLESLGFHQLTENPTTEHVQAGVQIAEEFRPDLLIGLGGGSSMDCAKGINFIYSCGGKISDYWGVGKATAPMPKSRSPAPT